MSKVLDEFHMDLDCPMCKIITEHHVQKTDENDNGEFIRYWAECDICRHIEDYSEEDLFSN